MLEKIKRIKISKSQVKDILIRTGKTALVAAVAAFGGAIAVIYATDLDELKVALYHALITAAIAAGTAVLNVFVKLWENLLNDGTLTQDEIESSFGGVING